MFIILAAQQKNSTGGLEDKRMTGTNHTLFH